MSLRNESVGCADPWSERSTTVLTMGQWHALSAMETKGYFDTADFNPWGDDMRIIVYDIEIAKAIQGRGEQRVDGIEYCKGWRDFKGMGIACICAYDYHTMAYRVFMEDNIQEFVVLAMQSRLLSGSTATILTIS